MLNFAPAECYRSLFDRSQVGERGLVGFGSEQEAVEWATGHPMSVDAIFSFGPLDSDGAEYTIRMNHSFVMDTRFTYDLFSVTPNQGYKVSETRPSFLNYGCRWILKTHLGLP